MDAITEVGYSPVPPYLAESEMSSDSGPPPTWEEVVGQAGVEGEQRAEPQQSPPEPPSPGALAWRNRRYFIIVLVPLLLCPIPIVFNNSIGYTAYSIMVMAIYWCTEALSLAVTALLPLVLFPAFGVMPAKDVAVQYLKDTNLLFFGGLMVAVAIEDCNLHRRIALGVLLLVGSKPRWMMLGFMIITAFLSMWISNTATTAMMLPIAQAVLQQLRKDNLKQQTEDKEKNEKTNENGRRRKEKMAEESIAMEEIQFSGGSSAQPGPQHGSDRNLLDESLQEERYNLMCKGIVLCVPYAANIGGTATLTGTGPNLVLAGQVTSLYGAEAEITFGEWMIYATPAMLLCLLLTWIWLQIVYVDRWCCKKLGHDFDHTGAANVIKQAYKDLGPMTFAEKGVLGHFILLIALWVTRKPGFVTGWSVLFQEGYVTDSTTAVFVSILLFIFPSRMPKFLWGRSSEADLTEKGSCPGLLDWPIVHKKMAWLVIILLGGGFALAEACKVSGLSNWIGEKFTILDEFPPYAIALVVSVIIAAFTEVTSNTATATIFLPILGGLGSSIGVNPLFLMLPATVACSFAFMLPVATPPNAIAFAYEKVTVMDMVKTGFILNVICVLIANGCVNTFGMWIFDVGNFPEWANINGTAIES